MTKKHDIIWLESIDSTNEEARRRLPELDNLSVLSARQQTAGRGQRGNTWSSEPGDNLTFSIVLKYGSGALTQIRAADQSAISEITALSVVDLLSSHGIGAEIKWPNDIYVGDRKVCGILIEHSVRDACLSSSIIGVGLNVNQTEFDPALPNPTSMLLYFSSHAEYSSCHPEYSSSHPEQSEGPIPLHPLLEEYMDIFKGYCSRYLNITGGLSRLRKLYLSQMWRKDVPARYIDSSDGREFEGIIRGLSEIGHLLVEDTEKGELREFAFKEISYII